MQPNHNLSHVCYVSGGGLILKELIMDQKRVEATATDGEVFIELVNNFDGAVHSDFASITTDQARLLIKEIEAALIEIENYNLS